MKVRSLMKNILLMISPTYRSINNMERTLTFLFNKVESLEMRDAPLNRCRYMFKKARDNDIDNYLDYFRLSSLELIASKIKEEKIPGECAELGVFQGEFARFINKYFPDRILYLFDTFEGFDVRDTTYDDKNNYRKKIHAFSNTNTRLVLDKMPYPEKCIIKEGYFPESIDNDILSEFCFVSIDVDLYKPTYAGLEYFYSKLVKGGVIFVHDYENCDYAGVKQAVKDFSKNYGLSYFIMSDICGSAVFIK